METGQNQERRRNKATIVDVAKKAGVAISTVSHVLNHTAPISEETRKRVQQAILDLDYTPNMLARNLRQKYSNVIGVIVPDIENEFYANVSSGIFRRADLEQDTVFLVDSGYSLEKEKMQVESLVKRQVDGLIFLGGSKDEELIDWAHKQNVAVVLGDRRYRNYCSVESDNFKAMRDLVLWVYGLGFRKIGYVSESLDMTNLQDRYNGLREGFHQCSLAMDEQWILNDSWLKLEKVDAAKSLMNQMVRRIKAENMPEIFLTSSDMIAIGIMDALIQNGYRVPEDISVVGFDDIRLVQYYNPPVTTIRQQCRKMGESCYQMLRSVLQGHIQDQHIVLETELICRQSVRL